MENNSTISSTNNHISEVTDKKSVNLWVYSTIILFLALVGLLVGQVILNQSSKLNKTPEIKNEVIKRDPGLFLYFTKQHLDQPLSQYDHALLSSPDMVREQQGKTWQALECLYPTQPRDSYTFTEIKKFVTDETLISGLQKVEEYQYKITVRNEAGGITEEYNSLQNIKYTNICKDSSNYYVLYLTSGDKKNAQNSLFVKDVYAGGGWPGQSNFAVIPFSGEVKIYENINNIAKVSAISDLSDDGFDIPVSKRFDYYDCRSLMGKLGDDLYAICKINGGSGLFKIPINPISFKEISFCGWMKSDSVWICYDTQGEVYYQYK